MALPQNRQGVQNILKALSLRIIGQTKDARSCCCGAIHSGPATAVKVNPGGGRYPGQETLSSSWNVSMEEDCGTGYSTCLSDFIPYDELDELFREQFGEEKSEHPYKQLDRSLFYVQIREEEKFIGFSFNFGKAQRIGEILYAESNNSVIKSPKDLESLLSNYSGSFLAIGQKSSKN